MIYKSNKNVVKVVMHLCKHDLCLGVGTLVKAEAKSLCPVLTGNLRRNINSDVMDNDNGVIIGVLARHGKGKFTRDTSYGLYVEEGTSKQIAQPFLKPGAMNSIPKISKVANQVYAAWIGDKK